MSSLAVFYRTHYAVLVFNNKGNRPFRLFHLLADSVVDLQSNDKVMLGTSTAFVYLFHSYLTHLWVNRTQAFERVSAMNGRKKTGLRSRLHPTQLYIFLKSGSLIDRLCYKMLHMHLFLIILLLRYMDLAEQIVAAKRYAPIKLVHATRKLHTFA